MDNEMNVQLAPSGEWLEEALYNGLGSMVRCLGYLNEIANLGFRARLENGINKDYVTAVKNTHSSRDCARCSVSWFKLRFELLKSPTPYLSRKRW
jgi:hypothetical protein